MSTERKEFEEFCAKITSMAREKLSEHLKGCLVTKQVLKRNGICKIGLSLEGKDIMFSPVIYLDDYYKKNVYYDLEGIVATVVSLLINGVDDKVVDDVEALMSYDVLCDKITYRLINKSMNMEYLKDKVYRDFLDLSIVYEISVPCKNDTGTIIITNNLAKRYNLTEQELFILANRNTPRNMPMVVTGLKDILGDNFVCEEGVQMDRDILYVLTNTNKVFGATTLVYPEACKKIYEKYGKTYLLPSSVHELLIVDHGIDVNVLSNMVREVNATVVDPEDILSESIYEVTENGVHIVGHGVT